MRGSSLHRDGGWCIQTRDKFLKYLAKYFKYLAKYFKYLAKFEKLGAAVSILDCLMAYTRLAVNPFRFTQHFHSDSKVLTTLNC